MRIIGIEVCFLEAAIQNNIRNFPLLLPFSSKMQQFFKRIYEVLWRTETLLRKKLTTVTDVLTSAVMRMQKIFFLSSVFILCFLAKSSNFWLNFDVDEVEPAVLEISPGPAPCQAEPTTHHLPRCCAAILNCFVSTYMNDFYKLPLRRSLREMLSSVTDEPARRSARFSFLSRSTRSGS